VSGIVMRAWTVDADDIRVAEDFDDALLDKPIGDKIFSRESIAVFASSPLPWSKVWLTAIALTVLKHTGAAEGLKVNARLAGLVADRQLHGVIDHFVRLLDFTPSVPAAAVAVAHHAAAAPGGGSELFNVRKEGSAEPDLWVRLHRLET